MALTWKIERAGPGFANKDRLYRLIDALPAGPNWICKEMTIEGDVKDGQGQALTETLEVWYRDPVKCAQELISNPMFRNHLAYAPERVYRDPQGTERQIDEMYTADWWWETQVSRMIKPQVAE